MAKEKEFDNNLRGALWESTLPDGTKTLSGSVEINKVEYWLNLYPTNSSDEKMPIYRVRLVPKKK